MIYRLLLYRNEPLENRYHNHLSPRILRTCRQILNEALPILYGENVWKIKIQMNGAGDERARSLYTDHFGREIYDYPLRSRLEYMKRFYIVVEVQSKNAQNEEDAEEEASIVQSALTKVSKVISTLPDLQYVRIRLCEHDTYGGDAQESCQVLENLTMLRNVHKVVFDGVPPVYAKYLTDKMTGSAPLDHLPNMYDALILYAGSFDFCAPLLQKACDAMEQSDVDKLKEVRAEIVEMVSQHMTYAFDHLFDHDARA